MAFLSSVHISCFLLSYLVALGCEVWQLKRGSSAVTRSILLVVMAAGFFAHTIFLIVRSRTIGLPPLLTSQQDWLLVMAWLGGLLYLADLFSSPGKATGLFLLPAMLVLIGLGFFVSDSATGNMQNLSLRRWGMFHAASLVLGIGAVLGSTLTGLMYLFSVARLRGRPRWLPSLALPSLENLTATNRWMVMTAVPLLTIGLVTGFLLIAWRSNSEAADQVSWSDPTIVSTIAVWLVLIGVLVRLLMRTPQPGRQVAWLTFLNGVFLLVSVLGPMLLAGAGALDTFHGRPRAQQSTSDRVEDSPRVDALDAPTTEALP